MSMIIKLREFAARRALEYKLQAELANLSDAELNDLDLSYAKISEMSRTQALAA